MTRAWIALGALAVATCTPYKLPPMSPRVAKLPARISEAGLYSDAKLTRLADDLHPYTPAYELWSDGATKRRWIRIPAGAVIDTTDMDSWSFPVGTQLWKEFSVDGKRIETRLLTRVTSSPDGWAAVAYAWNAAQTDAVASADGVEIALETAHDVPSARACMTCHGGRAHRALGFSAIQLSHAPTSPDDWTIDRLVEGRLLSAPPRSPIRIPGTPTEVAALGYLHSNCGSCHNSARPADSPYYRPGPDLDLWLQVASLSDVTTTPTYRSSIGTFVVPGSPTKSPLFQRIADGARFRRRMPPIATKLVDRVGLAMLERWIIELGKEPCRNNLTDHSIPNG